MLIQNKIAYSNTIYSLYQNTPGWRGQHMKDTLTFIGQEQDGTLLFHWHDISPGEEQTLVSFVGAYNPHKQAVKTVFIYDNQVNIVNATINKEHTFLAFTTVEKTEKTGAQGRAVKKDVYKAYIAEIQPQGRVFYLNLERPHYIKLQFLYGPYRPIRAQREAHLLIFLHKESIGLYHLPIARVGDEGFIMSGEPKKDQLFHRRFTWMQFDAAYQRLYVIYHRRSGKDGKGRTIQQPFFSAYQFVEKSLKMSQLMMDLKLPLTVPYMKDSTKSTYLHLGPYHSIPDASLNIEVLTNTAGAMCLCFQHIPDPRAKLKEENSSTLLQYSVYVIHKEKILQVQCMGIPDDVINQSRVCFAWIDGYLLAYLSGHFTHFLNVGVEFDLSLHIMYRENSGVDHSKCPHLVQFSGDKHLHSQSGVSLFDTANSQAVRLSIDHQCLVQLFKECTYLPTRAAIVHYATVQTKDLQLVTQLIEHLCQDPSAFDVVKLLQEYLTGSMYCLLAKHVERRIHRYLPYTFTSSSANRGQVYCQDNMERICSLSYQPSGDVTLEDSSSSLAEDPYWHQLANHIADRQWAINCRFNLAQVKHEEQVPKFTEPTQQVVSDDQSFFQRISSAARNAFSGKTVETIDEKTGFQRNSRISRPPSRVEAILGKPPAFLKKDEEQLKNTRYLSKTVELFCVHLLNFLTKESRTKTRHMAEELVKSQITACRLLCHVVWSVLGAEQYEDMGLEEKASSREKQLFAMYQKVGMAAEQLSFLMPSGFDVFFSRLGYRCQSRHEFEQFVERDVYSWTSVAGLVRLLNELPDTSDNVRLKWLIIHKLPKDSAVECLRHWHHVTAERYLAQLYVRHVISNKLPPSTATDSQQLQLSDSSSNKKRTTRAKLHRQRTQEVLSSPGANEQSFPPLHAFLKHVQAREEANKDTRGASDDMEFLKSVAQAYFR